MIKINVFMVLASVSLLSVVEGAEKPDFSGIWRMNREKTRLQIKVRIENLEKAEITIEHKEPDFRLSRIFVVKGVGSDTYEYALQTDGKEVAGREEDATTYSRLYWENDALVYVVRNVEKRGESVNTVRYSLIEGGKTLIADEKFRGPRLSYDNLWVFDKI